MTTPTTDQVRAETAAGRTELADTLAALPLAAWDTPSLCAGWRVREVVAHITMPFRLPPPRFLAELARSGFRFAPMADRIARRDTARLSPAELTAALRDNADHPWRPPGGGYVGALAHDVIHGLDVLVPLGLDDRMPPDRVGLVLRHGVTARSLRFFGVDLSGVELRADDVDWRFGEGQPVTGRAADLLLVLCGRRLPPGRLQGAAAGRFVLV